jgi:hypothetical protein
MIKLIVIRLRKRKVVGKIHNVAKVTRSVYSAEIMLANVCGREQYIADTDEQACYYNEFSRL